MINEKLTIRANSSLYTNSVELLIFQGDSVVTNLTFERLEQGRILEPSVRMGFDAAQSLLDDLWNAGFRPERGHTGTGELEATKHHLDDMRTIAFNRLKINNVDKQ